MTKSLTFSQFISQQLLLVLSKYFDNGSLREVNWNRKLISSAAQRRVY